MKAGIVASAYVVPAAGGAITDNFNRADGSLGASWTQIANAGSGGITISSNRVRSTEGFPTFVVHATSAAAANHYNSLKYDTTDGAGTVMGEPAMFICGDGTWAYPNANGYQLWIDLAGNLIVYKNATQIGSTVSSGVTPNTGIYTIKLSRSAGGVITVHRDATQVFSYSDGSPLTNLRHGFGWNSISFGGEYAYADDYECGAS